MLWSLGRLEIAQDHLPAEVEFNALDVDNALGDPSVETSRSAEWSW